MTSKMPSELQKFQAFIGQQVDAGESDLTPEQVLDLRRIDNPTDEKHAANVAVIREAVAEMEAGDEGRPYQEVLQEVRDKLQL